MEAIKQMAVAVAVMALVGVGAVDEALATGQVNDNRHNYNNTVTRDDSVNVTGAVQSNSQQVTVSPSSVQVDGDSTAQTVGQSINVESRRQVPGLGLAVSGDCVGGGFQFAVPIFGFSIGSTDPECQKINAISAAKGLGRDDVAARLLMDLDAVKNLDKPKPVEVNAHGWPVQQ